MSGHDEALFAKITAAHVVEWNGEHWLLVCGTKRYTNSTICINPVVYVIQPEYWAHHVTEHLAPVGLPALGEFAIAIAVMAKGTKGISIMGHDYHEQLELE